MAEKICIFYKDDCKLLATFLQDKLSSSEMGIDTEICNSFETRSDVRYKVSVFLISSEFLALVDLSFLQEFEERTSVLVLVGAEHNDWKQTAVKQGAKALSEWTVVHLKETDESVKKLLVVIIDIYEVGFTVDDSSENDTEEDETGEELSPMECVENNSLNKSPEPCNTGASIYKVLPTGTSSLVNAVKHVFRKGNRIYFLLEKVSGSGGVIDVLFHEDGSVVNADYLHDVYSYSFPCTERENFMVSFKEEEIGNGHIDTGSYSIFSSRYHGIPMHLRDSISSTSSSTDDSPYDVLPSRTREIVKAEDGFLSENAVKIATELSIDSENDSSSTLQLSASSKETDSSTEFKTHRGSYESDVSTDEQNAVNKSNCEMSVSNELENISVLESETKRCHSPSAASPKNSENLLKTIDDSRSDTVTADLSHSPSTETLISNYNLRENITVSVSSTDTLKDCDTSAVHEAMPFERPFNKKLDCLRALLEEEIASVNTQIFTYIEENEVRLRPHTHTSSVESSEMDDDILETNRNTVYSVIDEEPSHESLDSTARESKDFESEKEKLSARNSVESSDQTILSSDILGDDSQITFHFEPKEEDNSSLETDETLKAIVETSETVETVETVKQGPSASAEESQNESKPRKKPGFFKQQIKRLLHRSNTEPKLRVVVEAAKKEEKKKVSKSQKERGEKDAIPHSASAGGLQDWKERQQARRNSIRIQQVLDDKSVLTTSIFPKKL